MWLGRISEPVAETGRDDRRGVVTPLGEPSDKGSLNNLVAGNPTTTVLDPWRGIFLAFWLWQLSLALPCPARDVLPARSPRPSASAELRFPPDIQPLAKADMQVAGSPLRDWVPCPA